MLTQREFLILRILTATGEMYGLDLVEASSELKRGTIYVLLGRMVSKGYVESREVRAEHGKLPRHLFRATGLGERAFRQHPIGGLSLIPVWSN